MMELPDQDEIYQLSHWTLFHKRVVLLILVPVGQEEIITYKRNSPLSNVIEALK